MSGRDGTAVATTSSGHVTSTRENRGPERRVRTKRVMLSLPQDMPLDAWRNLGRQIHVVSDSSAWWLGDWLIYGQTHYPNRYKQAIAETSLDYQTLRNYAWVARRFTPERRHPKLSFQHHAEVTSLPEAEQDAWLTRAEINGWSRNELRRQLRGERQLTSARPRTVHIEMKLPDQQKERWQKAAERADQELLTWMVETLDHAALSLLESDRT